MKGFSELSTISEFLQKLLTVLPPKRLEAEECDLTQALGRILAEDVVSPFDLPIFDRSAVDGFALKASDSIGSSPTNPIEFHLATTIFAGSRPDELAPIANGNVALIFTGAPMPRGTDAVVMLEDCARVNDTVQVKRQVRAMQNVSRRGEDYAKNETVVRANTPLKPWHIAAIASINKGSVQVQRRLRIGVLSTGSEVVEPGQSLKLGKVANSTKPMLASFVKREQCEFVDLGTVPDDLAIIRDSITQATKKCDVVLTTGGSSVGEKDLVQRAISQIEGNVFVAHGLRLRPGRPTGVSLVEGKPVFLLSGLPVAAMAAFEAVVRPTIRYLSGTDEEPEPHEKGVLKSRVSNETGNRSYVRVRVTQVGKANEVEPLMLTGSGLLSTLTKANGILVIDESSEGYDEGDEVDVLMTGNVFRNTDSRNGAA
jgi:molybdopterin molybdotransferase